MLTPEGDWGTRVAAAFDEELRAAGGFMLGQASFGATTRNDFSDSITQVLRTDDSRTRHQRIQATIGQKLEFEPRRRPDIQFIFAPSQPGAARLLRPQLRFHLAGDIPTYTLGDAYEPHPTANQEIDGMMFPDMPWMLGDEGLSAEVREAARQAFGESAATPRPPVRLWLRRIPHRRPPCNAARGIDPAGTHRHAVASTRRAACAANSNGCASRMACPRRSNAPDTTAATPP